MSDRPQTRVVGPFNRVEGDLEVSLDMVNGRVAAARVNSPLYRGFEQILQGKPALDALVLVPRICGICSVSQSAAAAAALAALAGAEPPPNGRYAGALAHGAENLADHFSHFYLFFMPDFARADYAGRPWFAAAAARFKAITGSATAQALPARVEFLKLMGLLAGKWPHTLAFQPGGTSQPMGASEQIRAIALLRQFRGWLERHLFGDALEAIAALDSVAQLEAWCGARPAAASDFRLFCEIARDLGLAGLGRGPGRYLSFGGHPLAEGALFAPGVWDGTVLPVEETAIREDLSHAWLGGPVDPLHPLRGETLPDADKPGAYTWCKAPRWRGMTMEVGALARQMVDGHPLIRELAADGGNVFARVVARLLELARLIPAMERWAQAIEPGEPFCLPVQLPDEGSAAGLVEAARGGLGHWLTLRRGRLHSYQIIAPTTWNFSPRDAAGTPGPLEAALVGLECPLGAPLPPAIQHVVRSFDPCMVCTVH